MSDLPSAVLKLWTTAVSGLIEVGTTYYRAMTETLTDETDTGACSGEGDADAAPRDAPTQLRLSELRDGSGVTHTVQSAAFVPPSVPASKEFTPVKVSVVLPPTFSSGMLLGTLLDDAGAPASAEFSIFVSMPK